MCAFNECTHKDPITWCHLGNLKPGETAFDIGAHVCHDTRGMSQSVSPSSKEQRFEPNPESL
jgi:hypothetical protein